MSTAELGDDDDPPASSGGGDRPSAPQLGSSAAVDDEHRDFFAEGDQGLYEGGPAEVGNTAQEMARVVDEIDGGAEQNLRTPGTISSRARHVIVGMAVGVSFAVLLIALTRGQRNEPSAGTSGSAPTLLTRPIDTAAPAREPTSAEVERRRTESPAQPTKTAPTAASIAGPQSAPSAPAPARSSAGPSKEPSVAARTTRPRAARQTEALPALSTSPPSVPSSGNPANASFPTE